MFTKFVFGQCSLTRRERIEYTQCSVVIQMDAEDYRSAARDDGQVEDVAGQKRVA